MHAVVQMLFSHCRSQVSEKGGNDFSIVDEVGGIVISIDWLNLCDY